MGGRTAAFWFRIISAAAIVAAIAVGACRPRPRIESRARVDEPRAVTTREAGAARPSDSVTPSSAATHRDRSVAEVRGSGPDKQDLAKDVQRVVLGWSQKVSKAGLTASFGPAECHAKGCFVTIVQASEADLEQATRVITRTGEFIGWRAGKMRTGIIKGGDGGVEATWFLYPPPAGEPALPTPLPDDV